MKTKLITLFVVIVWVLLGIIAAQTAFNCSSKTVTEIRIDTVRIASEPDTVLSPVLIPKFVYKQGDTVHATDTLYKYIERYKYIKNVLGERDVKELLQFDTTAHLYATVNNTLFVLPAQLHTTADCIQGRITTVLQLDTTSVSVPLKTIIEKQKPQYSLGAGVGYGVTASGVFVPTLSINLQYIIWSN